ncbi:MAG: AAA family ATPase [Gracilimonas sp.]|uniref:AAA family ATPase n=1 Tax=Gracilimonas sp. TaxID=1974203 RepID=UPI0019C086F0|nr:AAA family ATPase [Gracilimonas sp.]MBD3617458.1 AAA family ATPase [Gracilimonas sp.]
MTEHSSKSNQSTIGDKLKALSQSHTFGQSLHVLRRDQIPSKFYVNSVDQEKWEEWIAQVEQEYQWLPENRITLMYDHPLSSDKRSYFLHLEHGITFRFDSEDECIRMFYDHESNAKTVEHFKKELKGLRRTDTKFEIGFLQSDLGSLRLKFRKFTPYEEDLTKFLADEVESLRKEMIASIGNKSDSGLYLLHGQPGTGKTSFIKTVLSRIKNKAIYITPGFAEHLSSPDLIGVLMDHPGSVLVIEDAETVLMKRQADNSNAVSNLLNLTDGFPADFLKLNIICTFNTNLDDIDPALLREGRLKGIHEFTKLTIPQAHELAGHLGKEIEITQPLTLAEVCNAGSLQRKLAVNGIGF